MTIVLKNGKNYITNYISIIGMSNNLLIEFKDSLDYPQRIYVKDVARITEN